MVNIDPVVEGEYPNWFRQTAQPNFQRYLSMVAGQPNLRFLQIGAFVGDASVWMLENVLTHPTSQLVDVDPWLPYADLIADFDWEGGVYAEYRWKIAKHDRVGYWRMTSNEFFRKAQPVELYDFIYIDGAHDSVSVLEDAVNSYRALKVRGVLAFDDYTWSAPESNDPLAAPAPAIDAVRYIYRDRLTTVGVGGQVWMVKNK